MLQKIILLSGPICSGKTTLLNQLETVFSCNIFKTSKVLRNKRKTPKATRAELQRYGQYLDKRTQGRWIMEHLEQFIKALPSDNRSLVIVDSVRAKSQIDEVRNAYGPLVFHFHLTAPTQILAERYLSLIEGDREYEFDSFVQSQVNATEKHIDNLGKYADILIDTARCTRRDLLVKAACHLGLYAREHERIVDVLVGGQYGSEGKGNIASYLAKDYDYLVRVGGPNAGHKVFLNPKPYTFHQLPSGTLHSAGNLVIGPGAVINPKVILREISDCSISCERLSIDPQAMIISEDDVASEAELRGDISSTQSGSGFALARRIMHRGKSDVILAGGLSDLKPFIKSTQEVFEKAFLDGKKILIEGTQGTALSLYHGRYPHVTSRDTTVAGCLAEAGISPNRVRKVIMVCRTYPIRVQNPIDKAKTSGQMSQEISLEEIAQRSGLPIEDLKQTEISSTTNTPRRIGEFEWDLLRRSSVLNAPTDIALTFVDYLSAKNREARRFDQLTDKTIRFVEEVERVAFAPVTLISTRFHHRSIIDRRNWR